MKNVLVLLACMAFIQGCSNNPVQTEHATPMTVDQEIMNAMEKFPEQAEFGTSCSYNGDNCSANQQQFVGSTCSCMSIEGLQNGSIE
jgi:hypothetical protein